MCRAGHENMCVDFPTLTYGGRDRIDGTPTLGGWSSSYVVRESFVYHRPAGLDPAAVAPLMCAGITVWEPLRGLGRRARHAGRGGRARAASATWRSSSPSRSAPRSPSSRGPPTRRTTPARSAPTGSWCRRTGGDGRGGRQPRPGPRLRSRPSTTSGPTCGPSTSTGRWSRSATSARRPSTPWTCSAPDDASRSTGSGSLRADAGAARLLRRARDRGRRRGPPVGPGRHGARATGRGGRAVPLHARHGGPRLRLVRHRS